MNDEDSTVRLAYASSHNINFHGELNTNIPRYEWEEMSDEEKEAVYVEAMYNLIEIYELKPGERVSRW